MISTRHGSGARRALRPVSLVLITTATLAAAAACSSSSSTSSSASSGTASSPAAGASGSASAAATTSAGTSAAGLAKFLPGKKATGTPVKVGLINNEGSSPVAEPSTGDAAVAAADYANAELGGIAGHPIQVIRCAENEDVASATACANEMVQDNVAVVDIGTTGLGGTMVPIITKAGIPYVSATGASPAELTTPGTFMWTGGFPADLAGMATEAHEHGYKKVTAFVIDTPGALAGAQQIGTPAFKAEGVTLTIESVPEAVADASTCTSILQALSTVAPGTPVYANTSCLNSSTLTALGNAMNGVKIFGRSDTESSDTEAALYRYVMATYYPSANPSGDTVTGYQGMLGLVRAIDSLKGAPTPASITAAIKAAKNIPLPAGAGLTFTCNGKAMAGLSSNCSAGDVVLTIENGKAIDPQVLN
jgi:branched-chain amino acid transport system substrate-binding protein